VTEALPADGAADDAGQEDAEGSGDFYAWVTTMGVDQFRLLLHGMRAQQREAMAVNVLHTFALRRKVGELVELARAFGHHDAVMLLATAALCRPVREAARLAVEQWASESREALVCGAAGTSGGAPAGPAAEPSEPVEPSRPAEATGPSEPSFGPLTTSILHDVACQRTAFDVALFVHELAGKGHAALVDHTLRVFAGSGSGRTNMDKALLHINLLGKGRTAEAELLLELTLENLTARPAAPPPVGEVEEVTDLAGAFQHLSPAGRILERWVEHRLRSPSSAVRARTRELTARLIARRGTGHDALAAHVARVAEPAHVVKLCALLAHQEHAPDKSALVRRHAACRTDVWELADLISYWDLSPELGRHTRDLLVDVVGRPFADPPVPLSPGELKELEGTLPEVNARPRCTALLRLVAAVHVRGRTGAEVAELLSRVESSRERTRAEAEAGRQLARVLMTSTGPGAVGADWFVDCLDALHRGRHWTAVRAACRELSDPSEDFTVNAALVAEVAVGLCRAEGLEEVAWNLLERFLENEQLVSPDDVVIIVREVLALPLPDAELLLRATVGRWSDILRRDDTVAQLRRAGLPEAAGWILKSLR
jgi:hypothetical protein